MQRNNRFSTFYGILVSRPLSRLYRRWVFARLMRDEIRIKRPIKQELWDAGMRECQACGQRFSALKGAELHRKDEDKGYSVENCELLCRECHQELPGR